MIRHAAIAVSLVALAGCQGIGLSKFDTQTAAGKEKSAWFDSFYGTPAKDESSWWGGFYGTSGETPSCGFYNSCPKGGGSAQMQGGGIWGDTSGGSSDPGSSSDTGSGW